MNEIRRYGPEPQEIAAIREIVGGRKFPEFVTSYDVRLGEIDGDPAAWIVFKLTDGDYVGIEELSRRADILAELRGLITTEWFHHGLARYPLFRSEYAAAAQPD